MIKFGEKSSSLAPNLPLWDEKPSSLGKKLPLYAEKSFLFREKSTSKSSSLGLKLPLISLFGKFWGWPPCHNYFLDPQLNSIMVIKARLDSQYSWIDCLHLFAILSICNSLNSKEISDFFTWLFDRLIQITCVQ